MSADRLKAVPIPFSAGVTFSEVLGSGRQILRRDLALSIRREIDKVQSRNASWAEGKLKELRVARGEPLLDVVVVDEKGDIVNSLSTYRSYANNAQVALTVDDLATFASQNEMFAYPVTGEFDTTLFWHRRHDERLRLVIKGRFGPLVVENYSVDGSKPDVKLTRVRGGLMGRGRFADTNVIYGRLGFWENRKLAMGMHGAKVYIERARFKQSELLSCDVYVSPLDRDEILKRGGVPMDSKQFGVDVVRVDVSKTDGDFITGSLERTLEFPYPVVLGYSHLRPWKGEAPKHG